MNYRVDNSERITYFAEADFRNKKTPFGIKAEDRARHMYVIGKTGMGKSTMLENMAIQDIQNGEGMAFIDPHGASAEALLDYVPPERVNDVVYFAPFDTDYPVSFNIMEDVGRDKRHLVSNGLMSAFKKIWVDAWSARMEYILSNTLLALLEYPNATLLGVNRMLVDKEYRKKVVEHISDPSVKSFWVDEFAKYTDRYTQEATPAIQNKIGQFVSNPIIRNIIGQPKSTFDIRQMMDEKKILIMNLSKGKMGEQNANLIGSMLVTKIYLAAMSRADSSASELRNLPPFYFYVDEFQSFANESFADILSEARKYKLSLTIAHQYIEQMPEEVRDAVFGNVGTMITFRVGAYDAEVLEKEFLPTFTQEDIVNLGKRQIYLRLMIDGVSSKPFSAVTIPPIDRPYELQTARIIEHSRKYFARSREIVEKEVLDWHALTFAEPKAAAPARPEWKPQLRQGFAGQAAPENGERREEGRERVSGKMPPRPPVSPQSWTGEDERRAISERRLGAEAKMEVSELERKPAPPARQDWKREPARIEPRREEPRRDVRHEEPKEERKSPSLGEQIAAAIREKPLRVVEQEKEKETHTEPTSSQPLDTSHQTPVSLNTLKREIPRNQAAWHSSSQKAQSPEHKNALKEALLSVMKEKSSFVKTTEDNPAESSRELAPKEIPEDVLRGMLKVEEK
ncbi:type IV secretion system DNA-binding domain-containing protein [bacterium]|nr:type IV secretion system DNA-binding domain-containing protein [bacterium]